VKLCGYYGVLIKIRRFDCFCAPPYPRTQLMGDRTHNCSRACAAQVTLSTTEESARAAGHRGHRHLGEHGSGERERPNASRRRRFNRGPGAHAACSQEPVFMHCLPPIAAWNRRRTSSTATSCVGRSENRLACTEGPARIPVAPTAPPSPTRQAGGSDSAISLHHKTDCDRRAADAHMRVQDACAVTRATRNRVRQPNIGLENQRWPAGSGRERTDRPR